MEQISIDLSVLPLIHIDRLIKNSIKSYITVDGITLTVKGNVHAYGHLLSVLAITLKREMYASLINANRIDLGVVFIAVAEDLKDYKFFTPTYSNLKTFYKASDGMAAALLALIGLEDKYAT